MRLILGLFAADAEPSRHSALPMGATLMKNVIPLLFVVLLSITSTAQVMKPRHIPNQNIDFVGFASLTSQLEPLREAY